MRELARGLFLAVVIGGLCDSACGDGKMFVMLDRVPAKVPYQRALLLFHEGAETLVLQSKYELPGPNGIASLGWVVPVPAVPELASLDAQAGSSAFLLLSFRAGPRVRRVSSYLILAAALTYIGFAAALTLRVVRHIVSKGRRDTPASQDKHLARDIVAAVAGFVLILGFLMPSLGVVREIADAEVVKSERVGIYDVKVIRGDTAGAITNWLDENGFRFDANDTVIFEGYVDRNWCFVTAQIAADPNTPERHIANEGLVAPLLLKFASEEPIYPLALTAATGADTEVLLYTLSDSKLTCGRRLKLRHAKRDRPGDIVGPVVQAMDPAKQALLDNLPEQSMMLCKFKGRLTPDQMKQDLILTPAPDNEPYRETKIVW